MSPVWLHVSFYELKLRDGELLVHLGSGLADDIIDRQITDPSMRICVQEPPDELVSFRARCGVAEMTANGPVPKPHDDEAEARGAWFRLLPIGNQVLSKLNDAWQKRPLDKAMQTALKSEWIEIESGIMKEADIISVRHSMAKAKLQCPEKKVFVRLSGTTEEVTLMLSLLGEKLL